MSGSSSASGSYLRSRLGLGTVVALLTAAQGIATIWAKSERWVGHWPSSSAVVAWAGLWGSCIAAGAVAWAVAAPRRGGYLSMLVASSRSRSRIYRPALLSVTVGSLVGYLAVVGYVVAMTAPRATEGGLDPLELLPLLAWVVMSVGIGATLGTVVPAPVVAPVVAAVVPYVIYMGAMYVDSSIDRAVLYDLSIIDNSAREYLRLPVELLVLRSALWLALGAALVTWMLGRGRVASVLAVVAGFAAAGGLVTANTRLPVPEAYAVVCADGAPRVCVDRAHDHLLPEYRDRVVAGLTPLGALRLDEATVVQSQELFDHATRFAGQAPPPVGTRIVVPVAKRNTAPAHEIDPERFEAHLGFGIFVAPCRTVRADQGRTTRSVTPGRRTSFVLYHWWLTERGLPTDGSNYPGEIGTQALLAEDAGLAEDARRFADLSDDDRAAWFGRHRDAVLTCQAGEPA
ncbi:hypothetical protein GA0074692_6665 [Micromonospora pallida]|uniref:ABC-type transport system involved in multi-copper enzyme maturation, permease component n=1 Tax=Micromonospora pallida TaxID=145854 RepID=A0A1C6TK48_9ACTN|nr:hypothetical protein [Micromonospora pallida]SCL42119.1 hypothetical protein GA0074692_6665 [Micromonospora pallida]